MPTMWRVVRTRGVLPPGFSKRFSGERGVTYLWGVPIGRFDIIETPDTVELRYRRWPVVDVLDALPSTPDADIAAAGFVRLPRDRRARFCQFRLTS